MAYRITGLPRAALSKYFGKSAEQLHAMGARRVIADVDRGFPCRVSLDDARAGESVLLLGYTSHDVTTPFRTTYAIFAREEAEEVGPFVDRLPPVFTGRTLSLRGFDAEGMLHDALLAAPGEHEKVIGELLHRDRVACIHAHYAAYGCFAARIEREGVGR
jgi:hypothetical protein